MKLHWLWVPLVALAATAAAADNVSDSFYSAIRENDLTRLATLIRAGAGVNVRDAHGETPLMYAAAVGSLESMQALLAAGADVNARTDSKGTALIWSATDLAKIKLLVEHGANVNATTEHNRSVLLVAAMSDNSAPIVRYLLDHGADPKAADFIHTTALRAATLGNDTETIRMLLDAGLDPNAADFAGITPLMMAAGWSGNLPAVKLLLAKGANVNAVSRPVMGLPAKNGPSKFGLLTALLMAAPFGPPELIQTLLDAGANVNAKDVRGMTPLMLAVAADHQNRAVIRMLLDHGADPQIKSDTGETAADWARRFGLAPGISLLKPSAEAAHEAPAASATPEIKPAVQRSIGFIETASWKFFTASGCVSCHAQSMTDMAVGEARTKGLAIDENAAKKRAVMVHAEYPAEPLLERMDPPGAEEQLAYPLAGFALSGYAPDRSTDAMAVNIAATQGQDGSFHVGAAARPPAEEGDIFRTAMCVFALKTYGPPGRGPEMQMRIAKARRWLENAKPETAEDRNMQLLGMHWAGSDKRLLARAAKAIVAAQRPDGGWAQHEGLPNDAYATGESLYALSTAGGIAPDSSAYRRGVKFLLSTQRPDGTWFVASRSARIQAYFEGGFPYGHDQWISQWGTSWAAMALTKAVEAPVTRASN